MPTSSNSNEARIISTIGVLRDARTMARRLAGKQMRCAALAMVRYIAKKMDSIFTGMPVTTIQRGHEVTRPLREGEILSAVLDGEDFPENTEN